MDSHAKLAPPRLAACPPRVRTQCGWGRAPSTLSTSFSTPSATSTPRPRSELTNAAASAMAVAKLRPLCRSCHSAHSHCPQTPPIASPPSPTSRARARRPNPSPWSPACHRRRRRRCACVAGPPRAIFSQAVATYGCGSMP